MLGHLVLFAIVLSLSLRPPFVVVVVVMASLRLFLIVVLVVGATPFVSTPQSCMAPTAHYNVPTKVHPGTSEGRAAEVQGDGIVHGGCRCLL